MDLQKIMEKAFGRYYYTSKDRDILTPLYSIKEGEFWNTLEQEDCVYSADDISDILCFIDEILPGEEGHFRIEESDIGFDIPKKYQKKLEASSSSKVDEKYFSILCITFDNKFKEDADEIIKWYEKVLYLLMGEGYGMSLEFWYHNRSKIIKFNTITNSILLQIPVICILRDNEDFWEFVHIHW